MRLLLISVTSVIVLSVLAYWRQRSDRPDTTSLVAYLKALHLAPVLIHGEERVPVARVLHGPAKKERRKIAAIWEVQPSKKDAA
jgi:hypothetical protein